MHKTEEDQFKHHQMMRGLKDLSNDSDSLRKSVDMMKNNFFDASKSYFLYDMTTTPTNMSTEQQKLYRKKSTKWIDSLLLKNAKNTGAYPYQTIDYAISQASNMVSFAESNKSSLLSKSEDYRRTELEWHHKFTNAIAVFVMFLIGAPLGGIIKKGGFGLPVVIAIVFFILMYVMTQQGDKAAKESRLIVEVGAWISNTVLFFIGLYFLNKARNDSRLFESDIYAVYFSRLKERFKKSKLGTRFFNKINSKLANQ
jgi:lipopolysaccharide export system permease protein